MKYIGEIQNMKLFSILCNASEEDIQRELSYFKKFREDAYIWEDFENFLIERGYKAERYFAPEPTCINLNKCKLN